MKRVFIALLMVSGVSGVITGCTTWPREYKGVTLADVERRSEAAHTGLTYGSVMPDACDEAYDSHALNRISTPSKINEVWDSCLAELQSMEEEAQARREKNRKERRQAHERRRARLQQEREDHGPRFLRLYQIAQYDGADKANELLAQYGGKYRINPHIQVTSCSGGICTADFPEVPAGMTGSGKSLNLLVKGIHAEPGRSMSEFELVRFETYGHGGRQRALAIFTRPRE